MQDLNQTAASLFHLEMLERGQYLARRGMINLSLPMTEREFDGFLKAVEDFLDENSALIVSVPGV